MTHEEMISSIYTHDTIYLPLVAAMVNAVSAILPKIGFVSTQRNKSKKICIF